MPVDFFGGENTEGSASVVRLSLTPEETSGLIHEVNEAYGASVNDVLLTALVDAWSRWAGSRVLLVDLESHGRDALADEIDISRTVGWFTSLFPVRLDIRGAHTPAEMLKKVKEKLRGVPRRGIGYGILRYLDPKRQFAHALANGVKADIAFNYLGQFGGDGTANRQFTVAENYRGREQSPSGRRTHLVQINGGIFSGCLTLEFSFSTNIHRPSTIEQVTTDFLASVRSIRVSAHGADIGEYTPSDFAIADLSQEALDNVLKRIQQ
jgi:non-ribosomal peptide synthase protein (TIGR01720 family)